MIQDHFKGILRRFNDEGNTSRLFYMVCKSFDGPIDEQAVIDWCYKIIAKSVYIKGKPTGANFHFITTSTKFSIIDAGYMAMNVDNGRTFIWTLEKNG